MSVRFRGQIGTISASGRDLSGRPERYRVYDYQAAFETAVEQVRGEGRYRVFADLKRVRGQFPRAIRRRADGSELCVDMAGLNTDALDSEICMAMIMPAVSTVTTIMRAISPMNAP